MQDPVKKFVSPGAGKNRVMMDDQSGVDGWDRRSYVCFTTQKIQRDRSRKVVGHLGEFRVVRKWKTSIRLIWRRK